MKHLGIRKLIIMNKKNTGLPAKGYNKKQLEFYHKIGGLSGLQKIINFYFKNIDTHKVSDIAKKFNILPSTLSDIIKNTEKKIEVFKKIKKDLQ